MTILLLGITSPIARALAARFARSGKDLYITGRDLNELTYISSDLKIRYGIRVFTALFEAEEMHSHALFFQRVIQECGAIEGVVVAIGYMGSQEIAIRSQEEAAKIFTASLLAPCSILSECANYFEVKESGFIVALSSVAADRGRQSNYYYGAAKSGLSTFMQGLRNRLYPHNVHVLTVQPGPTDTRMTFGKNFTYVACPERVAEAIYRAICKRKDLLYVPWFWRYIMWVVRSIPEALFKRLKL